MSRHDHPHHILHFPQLDRTVSARATDSVFQSARRAAVRVVGACGGRGTCGTCMVRVNEGAYVRLDEGDGTEVLHGTGTGKWLRACQIRPLSDCTLDVAARSLAQVVRAEPEHSRQVGPAQLDPLVRAYDVQVTMATLADVRADAVRVIDALPVTVSTIDVIAARDLPGQLRHHDWTLRALVRGKEWIGSLPTGTAPLGLAVDLGTTNAAAFLIDLTTGDRIGKLGIENPQTAWGADLIARINHAAREQEVADDLRDAAVAAINALAHDLCHANGLKATQIVDVVICGNTAMHHLLLGLPVRQLGRAPFVAAVQHAVDMKARDLGIAVAPGAWLHLAPNVGGFVGGDHVTALLATEQLWNAGETTLVMDIGTNTEISLIHDGRILSASCPSGPALEGGHISCGMRAAEGAIERVSIKDDVVEVTVIGGKEPVGLCGSGVLDGVAALLSAGWLNTRGRLAANHAGVKVIDGTRMAEFAPNVLFSQNDIRAVQLAKAAIQTAVDLLLVDAGLTQMGIVRFVIAGAFGAYIDVASGVAIGLFPDIPRGRFEQVGNAAGVGVQLMLVSATARARAAAIARQCQYVELSSRGEFQKTFLRNIQFPTPVV